MPERAAPPVRIAARLLGASLAIGACMAAGLAIADSVIDAEQAMRDSQAAIGRKIGDHRFIDQAEQPLQLAQFAGRPLLISYVYTSCGFVCPTLTSRLAQSVAVAREALGETNFNVLTVGFDTRVDTPEQMRRFAAGRGIRMPGWYFASGDQETVDQLAREIGFSYAPSAGGFDHLAQVTIVDRDGRVYGQVYGPDFEPPMIVDPLKRLALGTLTPERPVADFLNKVRLLCTSYDPRSGRYRFDYSLILELAIGLSCTIVVGIFLVRAWRQSRTYSAPR